MTYNKIDNLIIGSDTLEDKERIEKLYNKMITINTKTMSLIDSINHLEEVLPETLNINHKVYKLNSIDSEKKSVIELKNSIKSDIINNLEGYL